MKEWYESVQDDAELLLYWIWTQWWSGIGTKQLAELIFSITSLYTNFYLKKKKNKEIIIELFSFAPLAEIEPKEATPIYCLSINSFFLLKMLLLPPSFSCLRLGMLKTCFTCYVCWRWWRSCINRFKLGSQIVHFEHKREEWSTQPNGPLWLH